MSWLEFIAQMSQAWAWPAVAGGSIILLRRQIKSTAAGLAARVGEIRRFKAPGVDVEFERQVRELAATTAATTEELRAEAPKALPSAPSKDVVLPPETADERLTKYHQLAALDPRAAILLPYADIESAIRERFRQLYPQERWTMGFRRIVDILHRDGLIDVPTADALGLMSKMRNQVAHENAALDVDIANDFVESVGNVFNALLLTDFFGDTPE